MANRRDIAVRHCNECPFQDDEFGTCDFRGPSRPRLRVTHFEAPPPKECPLREESVRIDYAGRS